MSFPCELKLKTTTDGPRLFAWPVTEIESLIQAAHSFENITLKEGDDLLAGKEKFDLVDLEIEFDPGAAKQIAFSFPGVKLTYDTEKQTLVHTGVEKDGKARDFTTFDQFGPRDGSVRLRLLIDRLSVEAYKFDGEDFRAHYYSPKHGDGEQSIIAIGGDAKIKELVIRELKSAW